MNVIQTSQHPNHRMNCQTSCSTPLTSQPAHTYHGEWNPYKDLIRKKYLEEGLTQSQLRDFMRVHHGFDKSVSQYERILKKWSFKKNNSQAVYRSVANALKHQSLSIESASLVVNGETFHTKNLRRKLTRHLHPTLSSRWRVPPQRNDAKGEAMNSGSSEKPPSIHVLVRPTLLSGKDTCAIDHSPWIELIKSLQKLSVSTVGTSYPKKSTIVPASKALLSSDSIAVVLCQEPDCVRLPAEALLGLILSRIARDLNSGTTIFGCQIRSLSQEELTRSLFRLESFIPQRFQNDLEDSLGIMICGSLSESTIVAISYLCYLLSNNHLTNGTVSKCISLLSSPEYRNLLSGLLASTLVSARSVLSVLLREACQSRNVDWLKICFERHNEVDPNILLPGYYHPQTPLQIALTPELDQKLLDATSDPSWLKTIEHLLKAGANPNLCGCHFDINHLRQRCTGDCCTALPLASALKLERSSDIITTLLDFGAQVCSCLNITMAIEKDLAPDVLKRLLDEGASPSLNGKNGERHWFPLQASLGRKDSEIANLLLDYGAHPNEFFAMGDMVLEGYLSYHRRHKWDKLQSLVWNHEMRSPLALSLKFDLGLAQRLIYSGANVNDCYYEVMEYLPGFAHLAHHKIAKSTENSSKPWSEIDEKWLDPTTVLTENPEPFETSLEAAVSSGCYEIVKLMIQKGASPNGCHNTAPLVIAARMDRSDIVELLLDSGALANSERPQISLDMFRDPIVILTPLATAYAHGHTHLAAQLIMAGADVNDCHNEYGLTPLQAAAVCGARNSMELLLCNPRVDASHPGSLFWSLDVCAAVVQHEISKLFTSCSTPDSRNARDLTIKSLDASVHGFVVEDPWFILQNLSTTKICHTINDTVIAWSGLRQEKAAYTILSEIKKRMNRAFLHALISNRLHVAWWILQQAFTVDIETAEIALKFVLSNLERCMGPRERNLKDAISSIKCVLASRQWLLIQKPTSSIIETFFSLWFRLRQIRASSDITFHIENCAKTLSRKLCRHEGNLKFNGQGLLRLAIEKRDFEFASILLRERFEVNCIEDFSDTPLVIACSDGNEAFVLDLLNHGADVNFTATSIESQIRHCCALGAACEGGHLNIVKILISQGALIDGLTDRDYSPLMRAAACDKVAVINELIICGADVNYWASVSSGAQTPLQAACSSGSLNAVIVLLNNNADVNAPAGACLGRTALQAAAEGGYLRIVQILVGAGSKISAPASPEYGQTAIDIAAEDGRLDTLTFLLDNYDGDESVSTICDQAIAVARENGRSVIADLLASFAESHTCWPRQESRPDTQNDPREHASEVNERANNSTPLEPEFNIFDYIHEDAL